MSKILNHDGIALPPLNPHLADSIKKLHLAHRDLESGNLKSFALITLNSQGALEIHFHGANIAELHMASSKLGDILKKEVFK